MWFDEIFNEWFNSSPMRHARRMLFRGLKRAWGIPVYTCTRKKIKRRK